MVLVFKFLQTIDVIDFDEKVIDSIRTIIAITLLINIFLAGSELFAELYSDSAHTIHISHLFGLHGFSVLAPLSFFMADCILKKISIQSARC